MVAHQTFLYDDLTALENLVYYGRLFGLNDPEKKADEALSRLGMDRRSGQRLRNLSHGMQKRVAIARAIMHQPPILLLDEPESGLDRGSVELLKKLLQEWAASGRAVVMTTHDTELGFSWTGQLGLLAEGKLHLRGPEGPATLPNFTGGEPYLWAPADDADTEAGPDIGREGYPAGVAFPGPGGVGVGIQPTDRSGVQLRPKRHTPAGYRAGSGDHLGDLCFRGNIGHEPFIR